MRRVAELVRVDPDWCTKGVGRLHIENNPTERKPNADELTTSVILAIIIASSGAAFGADAAALCAQRCASCRGKDDSGNTTMGKKLGVKDYTKKQGFSDAEAANVIKNGKDKMKGYKDKLADGGLFSTAVGRSLNGGATSLLSQASCYILTAGSGSSCGLESCGDGDFCFRPPANRSMT